ncbi:hypothetical protein N566_02775 [Streptomycetaceae bacterium MP113-05]|nr:hypothetical protein N566_02775 [Streptomycetaceae bacterium MP113-05]
MSVGPPSRSVRASSTGGGGEGDGSSWTAAGSVSAPSLPRIGRDAVAVQPAQKKSNLAMKLIHSSSAMGVPNAPYMLFAATSCR